MGMFGSQRQAATEEVAMNRSVWCVLGVLGLGLLGSSRVADAADLKVGDKAPDFSLPGSDGKTYSLHQFKGKKAVVIAWFPKAFTGGCTAECKSFRENSDSLKPLNVAYYTASVDTPEENKKFAESLGLDYPILSDPTQEVAKAYGVYNADRKIANRWTFYIDKDGVIKAIDKKINTKQAGADLASKIKELGLSGE
jgi:peroxiredoxin Q/BCP